MSETSEKFGESMFKRIFSHSCDHLGSSLFVSVKAAERWDAWNRPGLEERPDYDLPSALRLKYKNSVSVKRLAAAELRTTSNTELAAEVRQ